MGRKRSWGLPARRPARCDTMSNVSKQSYKQSYTDNVELSIFNCGHEYCQPGHTWGPGVRDH